MNERLKEQIGLTFCPECDTSFRFIVHPEIGDVVLCLECSTTLEVQETFPLTLDWHFEKPFRGDEQFFDENWDEWNDETETDHSFQWESADKNEKDNRDQWDQFLEQITSKEKAFVYA